MPEVIRVNAKAPKVDKENPPEATIELETGATAQELIELYGDEPVKTNALSKFVIKIQDRIRKLLEAGKTQDEIQATLADMRMDTVTRMPGMSKKDKVQKLYSEMSAEDRKELLKALKAAS